MDEEIITHLIKTIRFRLDHAIGNVDEKYSNLSIGNGVRTPIEILYHMRGVIYYAIKITGGDRTEMESIADWKTEVSLFYQSLEKLHHFLTDHKIEKAMLFRIIQGPLTDVVSHIGQLAMLSRMNGQPVEKVNYSKVVLT